MSNDLTLIGDVIVRLKAIDYIRPGRTLIDAGCWHAPIATKVLSQAVIVWQDRCREDLAVDMPVADVWKCLYSAAAPAKEILGDD